MPCVTLGCRARPRCCALAWCRALGCCRVPAAAARHTDEALPSAVTPVARHRGGGFAVRLPVSLTAKTPAQVTQEHSPPMPRFPGAQRCLLCHACAHGSEGKTSFAERRRTAKAPAGFFLVCFYLIPAYINQYIQYNNMIHNISIAIQIHMITHNMIRSIAIQIHTSP